MKQTSILNSAARSVFTVGAAGYLLAGSAPSVNALPIYVGPQVVETNPGNLVGRFTYRLGNGNITTYHGTACVIKAESVLTSAYNLYDYDTGWTTRHRFARASDPSKVSTPILGRSTYILSGYRPAVIANGTHSDQALAGDAAGVILWSAPASGAALPFTASGAAYLRDSRTSKQLLGYGAENGNTGLRLLREKSFRESFQVYRSLHQSTSMAAEGGMIGGPALGYLDGRWTVIGLIVGREGADRYSGALIRATDTSVSNLLGYLR